MLLTNFHRLLILKLKCAAPQNKRHQSAYCGSIDIFPHTRCLGRRLNVFLYTEAFFPLDLENAGFLKEHYALVKCTKFTLALLPNLQYANLLSRAETAHYAEQATAAEPNCGPAVA